LFGNKLIGKNDLRNFDLEIKVNIFIDKPLKMSPYIKLLCLFLGYSFGVNAQEYYSKTLNGGYARISLREVDNITYYSITQFDNNQLFDLTVVNLTDLPFINNKISIPDSERYWFIPFNGSGPIALRNIQISDECSGNCIISNGDRSSCSWITSNNNSEICKCESGSGDQSVVLIFPEQSACYETPGIFLIANVLISE
jgi:hypothetical protein